MTSDASILVNIDETKRSTISLANGQSINSAGVGNTKIVSVNGKGTRVNVTLGNVYHVPMLTTNLLSVSKITDLGFEVVFDSKGCRVVKGANVMLVGERSGNLYNLKHFSEQVLLTGIKHSVSCMHLWHRRLGHRDLNAVMKIVSDELGHGLKLDHCDMDSVCVSCCQGKMSRGSFPKTSTNRSTAVGELVHTDLGGPMEVATPRGNRFYVMMVDDYSRCTTVYLLQHKSDAAEKIREYCNLMKNQFGYYPKKIRSDGGGEYSNLSLKKFFVDNGVVHEQSAPYSPQKTFALEGR